MSNGEVAGNVTRLYVVRHGETVGNRQSILQGWFESPLNENGLAQAGCAAGYLKNKKIDAAYSSCTGRAVQTAEIILQHHPGVTLNKQEELREWHLGECEGRDQRELLRNFPDAIEVFRDETMPFAFPGGESREEFHDRVECFFEKIIGQYAGKTVLICAHGGTIQRIFRMAVGVTSSGNIAPMPANGAINTILYFHDEKSWQLESWNIREHIKDVPSVQALLH